MENRKSIAVTPEETEILRWLYAKTLTPIAVIVAVNSIILFIGLGLLMKGTGFGNYGVAPGAVTYNVTRFISVYIFIAFTNIVLMAALSALVMYTVLHTLVMPLLRITRQLRRYVETREKPDISVRNSDKLLSPLVELIHKLL